MALKNWIIFGMAAAMLSGCGLRERLFGVDQSDRALPFETSLARGDDRRNIEISVRANGATVSDVRESVRFAATRYCLSSYGGSDTLWEIDPMTQDWAFRREGQDMIFNGRCVAR